MIERIKTNLELGTWELQRSQKFQVMLTLDSHFQLKPREWTRFSAKLVKPQFPNKPLDPHIHSDISSIPSGTLNAYIVEKIEIPNQTSMTLAWTTEVPCEKSPFD